MEAGQLTAMGGATGETELFALRPLRAALREIRFLILFLEEMKHAASIIFGSSQALHPP